MSPGPTTEAGAPTQGIGVAGWSSFIDESEYAPDLMWPRSRSVYERMLNDSQIQGLIRGTTLPIRRYRWMLDPNGASDSVVQELSEDLNLPIQGQEQGVVPRRKGRFAFDRHLTDALRALSFGHYFFEQVGMIDAAGKWRIKKLAPRPVRTIEEINVERDGGLRSIKVPAARGGDGLGSTELKVDRLLAYVWEQESGNWYGRSMLRACYRNWLLKDRLIRVDAIKHERTGMGVPVAEAPEGASKDQMDELNRMAQSFKVTEAGGGAVPHGSKMQLLGTTGTVPDTIASARFHNEEMARAFLMMFMQLGQTETGSRALGSEFIDFFTLAQEAVADWVVDTFNEFMIEDWVDWNYGEDEPAPLLMYESEGLSIDELATLVDKKIVTVDDELEGEIREAHKLPARQDPRPTPQPPPVAPPPVPPVGAEPGEPDAEAGRAQRTAEAAESLSLPAGRTLRRQPYEHEVAAQVDFAAIDVAFRSGTDALVADVRNLQAAQIDELHDLIVAARGDMAKLAALEAQPVAQAAILEQLQKSADEGITTAMGEAERQGKSAKRPNVSQVQARLEARAAATDTLLARSISEAAGRQAIRRTAPNVTPATVAAQVKEHLSGLSDAYLKDQLGGAVTQAVNDGRREVMRENPPKNIYSSELLDENTCQSCISVDGTEYSDIAASESDYPTGGYGDCEGGPRCRGTVVASYD